MEDLGIKGVQMSMLQPPLAKLYIDELDVLQEMYFVEWRYPEFVVPSLSLSLSGCCKNGFGQRANDRGKFVVKTKCK